LVKITITECSILILRESKEKEREKKEPLKHTKAPITVSLVPLEYSRQDKSTDTKKGHQ